MTTTAPTATTAKVAMLGAMMVATCCASVPGWSPLRPRLCGGIRRLCNDCLCGGSRRLWIDCLCGCFLCGCLHELPHHPPMPGFPSLRVTTRDAWVDQSQFRGPRTFRRCPTQANEQVSTHCPWPMRPLRPWTTQQLWPPACSRTARRCCAPSWYPTGTQSFRMMTCAAEPVLAEPKDGVCGRACTGARPRRGTNRTEGCAAEPALAEPKEGCAAEPALSTGPCPL